MINDVQMYAKLKENYYLLFVSSDCLSSPVSPQDDNEDKLTWKDRFPGYLINVVSILFMVISLREHLPMTYAC